MNHIINVNVDCKNALNEFYSDGVDSSIDVNFFNTSNPDIHSRTNWKNSILNKFDANARSNLKQIGNTRKTQLFFDTFSNQLYEQVIEHLIEKYEYEGSILKGKLETKDPIFVEKFVINDPDAKVYIIGDIHGSLHTLYYILNKFAFKGDTWELEDGHYIAFLGDIVDYSYFSLECLALVYLIYMTNKSKVIIVNGNHEDKQTYSRYEFEQETRTQIAQSKSKWEKVLRCLPSAIYLNYNGKMYHLSHGAFDPKYCLNPLEGHDSKLKQFLQSDKMIDLISYSNPYDLDQFKWGDFYQSVASDNVVYDSSGRDKFSKHFVNEYLTKNNIECILSGHQDNVPIGLLKYDESATGEFILEWEKGGSHANDPNFYDLYVPSDPNFDNDDEYCNSVIKLTPKKDFIALVTSTSTQTKPVSKSCFLTLEIVQTIAQNAGNKSYEHLYYKYKLKYLHLKNIIGGNKTEELSQKELTNLTTFLNNFPSIIINHKYANPNDLNYLLDEKSKSIVENIIKYYIYTYNNPLIKISNYIDKSTYFSGLDIMLNACEKFHSLLIHIINNIQEQNTKFIIISPGESMTKLWFTLKMIHPEFFSDRIILVDFPLSKASSLNQNLLTEYLTDVLKNIVHLTKSNPRKYIFTDYVSSRKSMIKICKSISEIDSLFKNTFCENVYEYVVENITNRISVEKHFFAINLTSAFITTENNTRQLVKNGSELLTYLTEGTDFEVSRCCPKLSISVKNSSVIRSQAEYAYFRCNVISSIIFLYYKQKDYLINIIEQVLKTTKIKTMQYIKNKQVQFSYYKSPIKFAPSYTLTYYDISTFSVKNVEIKDQNKPIDELINKPVSHIGIYPEQEQELAHIKPNNIINIKVNHLSYNEIINNIKNYFKARYHEMTNSDILYEVFEIHNLYLINRILDNNKIYSTKFDGKTPLYELTLLLNAFSLKDEYYNEYLKLIHKIVSNLDNSMNIIDISGSVDHFMQIYENISTPHEYERFATDENVKIKESITKLLTNNITNSDIQKIIKSSNYDNILKNLYKNGYQINDEFMFKSFDSFGKSIFDAILESNNVDLFKLIFKPEYIDKLFEAKNTLLHLIVKKKLNNLLQFVLDNGANKEAKNILNQTPYDIAVKDNNTVAIGILS